MRGVPEDQLDAATRARLGLPARKATARRKPRDRSVAKGDGRWRCVRAECGFETTVWAEVERHEHPRVELVLEFVADRPSRRDDRGPNA